MYIHGSICSLNLENDNGDLRIGCKTKHINDWIKNKELYATEYKFTKKQVDEYLGYIKIFQEILDKKIKILKIEKNKTR